MISFSRRFILKRDQILVLIAKDFKLKYNSTVLGFLWSLLVPTMSSAVYYFVFGEIMRFDVPNYLLYLMSGTFLWQFLSNVIMQNGGVLMANQSLLKKTSFDRELLIRGTFYTESIHFFLTIPILIGIMAMYGVKIDWVSFFPNFLVSIAALQLLTLGVSYAYAACNLYFRDLERIMGIILMLWMFCSPVFIPLSVVPKKYLWIFDLNPAAVILSIWRSIFYEPALAADRYAFVLVSGLAVFLLGRLVFRKMEPSIAEMM